MTTRIHTARADEVAVSVLGTDQLVELYGDEMGNVSRSLVIEDTSNCEALALMGTDEDFRDLAQSIAWRASTQEPRVEAFYCSCRDDGRAQCEEMFQRVLGLLQTGPERLLSRVVQSLNWDFSAVITGMPNDMWSAVVAETDDKAFRTYIQCDELEYGVAGTWLAFYERFPDRFKRGES